MKLPEATSSERSSSKRSAADQHATPDRARSHPPTLAFRKPAKLQEPAAESFAAAREVRGRAAGMYDLIRSAVRCWDSLVEYGDLKDCKLIRTANPCGSEMTAYLQ